MDVNIELLVNFKHNESTQFFVFDKLLVYLQYFKQQNSECNSASEGNKLI